MSLTRARSPSSKSGLPILRLLPNAPSRTVAPCSPAWTPMGVEAVVGHGQHPPPFIRDTNAIESMHARFRRAVRARGHFPNEQAALKCLYLTILGLDHSHVPGCGVTRRHGRRLRPRRARV